MGDETARSVTISRESRETAAPMLAAWSVEGDCGFTCDSPEARIRLGKAALRYKIKPTTARLKGALDVALEHGIAGPVAIEIALRAIEMELAAPKKRRGATR